MATKKTATKKAPKKTEEQEAAELAEKLSIFEQQQITGIVMARATAHEVFGKDVDPKIVLRIQEFLAWEDNGDPAEIQTEILDRLKHAQVQARELLNSEDPKIVLDVHEMIHEDFFGDEEDEGEEDDE